MARAFSLKNAARIGSERQPGHPKRAQYNDVAEIRCTKKLLGRFQQERGVQVSGGAALGNWVANIVPVFGGEVVLALNELYLLTLVLPSDRLERLPETVGAEASKVLLTAGAPPAFAGAVQAEAASALIAQNRSRHFVGLLNQVSAAVQEWAELPSPFLIRNQAEMENRLLGWLYGPHPNYRHPKDEIARAIERFRE